jgi:hypothetical protein
MKQAAAHTTTHDSGGKPGLGVATVALTFLDTTWRIAVPVIGFTILGIYVDLKLDTKPWLTFLSVLLGFGGAVLLVKRQIATVQEADRAAEKARGAKK